MKGVMETREWYLAHQYTEEDITNLERFFKERHRIREIRSTISNVCDKLGLLFLAYERSINADSLETINAAISVLRSKNIEPIKVSVSMYGSYQYSAFYNF
jgi:hypothetical protein